MTALLTAIAALSAAFVFYAVFALICEVVAWALEFLDD